MTHGIIYQHGNPNSFAEAVIRLLENPDMCDEMGRNAYNDMVQLWNAEIAAERLLVLASNLLLGVETIFTIGPCSSAKVIKNNWLKSKKQ